MIRKLFKFIFKLILILLILAIIIVAALWIAITDKTDEAPISEYGEVTELDSILGDQLKTSLDKISTDYNLEILFDEKQLNNLLYTVVKTKLNENYNPQNATSLDESYVKKIAELPSGIPFIGGDGVGIKSIYGTVNKETEELGIYITARASDWVKTRISLVMKVETTEDSYDFQINTFKLGKISLKGGLIIKLLNKFGVEDKVNEFFKNSDMPFRLNLNDVKLVASKEDLSNWIKGLLKVEEGDMKAEFVETFLNPEYDMVKFGMFTRGFGLTIDLSKFKVEEKETTLDPEITEEFDTNLFIKNKAQSFIFNSLSSNEENQFLTFTEQDMSRLIYSNMNHYEDFKIDMDLLGEAKLHFSIDGIEFDVNDNGTNLDIKIIMNINGMKTIAILGGQINQVNEKEIKIALSDKIKIGNNIMIGSSFVTDLLKDQFKTSDIMKFDANTNSLVFTTDVLNTFIGTAMGSESTPLTIEKIKFVKNALNIYVKSDAISAEVAAAMDSIKEVLKGDFLDETKFSAEAAEQVAVVKEKLDVISTQLSNGDDLTPESTEALVEALNELPTADQEELLAQIQASAADPSVLESLYSNMFN